MGHSSIPEIFGYPTPLDAKEWHRWLPFWPVRLIEGRWSIAEVVWRRKTAVGWEYSERQETEDEFQEMQW